MEKHALYHMTWKEIEEVFKNDPVVIIPIGFYRTAGNTFFNRRLSGC